MDGGIGGVLEALEVLTGGPRHLCPLLDPSIASIWVTYANGSREWNQLRLCLLRMCIFSPSLIVCLNNSTRPKVRVFPSFPAPDEAAKFFFSLGKVPCRMECARHALL